MIEDATKTSEDEEDETNDAASDDDHNDTEAIEKDKEMEYEEKKKETTEGTEEEEGEKAEENEGLYVEESFYEDEDLEKGTDDLVFLQGGTWPDGVAQLAPPRDVNGLRGEQYGAGRGNGGLRRASRDLGLSHYPHSESAPQLRYTPIEQTVSPGAPVSLKCSAVGSPLPVITWTRDQQPLPPSHRTSVGSFRTALGQVVSHVNLSDVTVREGGAYTCTAHNAHGSQSHSARVNVYGPPFVRAMPNITAVAGEDVRLWCPAGGFPTPAISWRRDNRALPASIKQEVQSNGTLLVRAASHEDAGRYSCVVTGRQGQTAASHTFLHVLKPPEIDTFTFRQGLEEGRRTQLSCMVTSGDLPITINWLKDGRHLQHDPDLESKQVSDFSMVLVFKRLQEHHSGAYTCEAANAAAAVNHTAMLKVKVSPRWVVEPGGGTALVGSTVVLDCSARGHPQPVITWMKAPGKVKGDFQPLVVDGLSSSQASNGSLILKDAKTTDAGWYLCRAGNSVGKPISKAVQLTVHAPARVVTEGGRVTGHAGQVVTVACEATGDDPLTLTWLRHHAPISPGHRATVTESEGGGMVRAVLEMRSVTSADAGPYTCRASNPHGDHSQVFDVAIIEPPTPPSNVGISEVTSRSAVVTWSLPQPAAVTIQYKAEGETWSKQGRNVSVGQWTASHVLTGLSPHLTYAVRLMAHNDLGVSLPSPTQMFTTTEEAPSGAPRDVRVAASGPRSLLVTWRAPDRRLTHGALRGYTLALRRQNLQGHFTFITRPVTDLGGVEQYEVRGLVPATLYEVAVRAFTRAGPGPLSSPRIVDSTSHDAPSCAPAGVSCRGSGRGGVRVWWSPPPASCVHAPVSGYTIVATPARHVQASSTDGNSWEVNTTNLEKNLDALPPATNISVRVKAYNEIGFSPPSRPVFCITEDDVPGSPEGLRAVVTGPTTLLVTWSPPRPHTGTILHYTLYSSRDDQVAMRDVVGAGGSEATWRELSGLTTASRVQVWVTATTVAGEGNQSPRITAIPNPKPSYTPVAVGGGRLWQVGVGAGVTLGCRGLGSPTPTISWTRGGVTVTSGQLTQLLPGGDLHLTAVRESDNYTCWARSSAGVDSLTHQVVALTPPAAPSLSLSHATYHALNLTITPAGDGGAPILGYTVHHRGRAGEWVEVEVAPGVSGAVVRGLPCGAPHHVYLTAWNSQGASAPSPVLVASTLGSPPGRPEPERLVEVNSTCVTLRLYAWPELGCPVTHWKVELGSEEDGVAWTPLHSRVTLDTTDLGVCDLASASWHLLRVTASSTAGDTTVVYRVATTDGAGGSIAAESIQEVLVSGGGGPGGWLDAHIVAGVVSALLLATAFIICVCVAVRRRRYGGYRQGDSVDTKGGGGEDDNARNSELTRAHLYSPTPTKKPRGSLASLKTQDDASDPYEICPYATFSSVPLTHCSVGSSDGTLEYGLSLHAMTPRDCLDHPSSTATHPHPSDRHAPAPPQSPAAYGHVGRQRSQSHYKETEIAYITRGGRGEYGSRPKSIPGAQLPPTSNTAPAAAPVVAAAATPEQRQWAEEARKDTRGRQHRPRSRTRADTPGGGRDSSTESNDASSPVQQGRHHHHFQHHHHHQQAGGGAGVRVGPHPLPPVRHARARTESSSSDSSTLTPPRPLHPPSAFSDSRELSEAECDRELRRGAEGEAGRTRGGQQEIKAELTVLLQRYQQQQQHHRDEDPAQQPQPDAKRRAPERNPYTINV
ncbi:cell adhesion molecule Dscam2-like isoform X2 [Eriocheir sinensis]|uniref:cell adhesion molecule Dscam2-like isoform X2 n=1 Tax=Eriocheir sinensis TaxID=95602 RepID=UPI0021C63F5B|nr:cell adhesion molecule Dscam2-like isoform X2 [Eriocheir sinensis]